MTSQKLKPLILILGINLAIFLLALLFSINKISNFVDNWFYISIFFCCIFSLRYLYERGAYDSFSYSMSKFKGLFFSGKKEEVIEEYTEKRKTFKDIHDYIEYRKAKRTKTTDYLLGGSILSTILSVIFSII